MNQQSGMALLAGSKFLAELQIRCEYAVHRLLISTDRPEGSERRGLGRDDIMSDLEIEAWQVGQQAGYADQDSSIPALFRDIPALASSWRSGYRSGQEQADYEENPPYGSVEEFEALSDEERDGQWERFHELCAQGIADDMYFYHVMMDKWMVGYVGH